MREAYLRWERNGRPNDSACSDYFAAEREVLASSEAWQKEVGKALLVIDWYTISFLNPDDSRCASGTLVSIEGSFGILTARHIGLETGDQIRLLLNKGGGRTCLISTNAVRFHYSKEWNRGIKRTYLHPHLTSTCGTFLTVPDVVFIELFPGPTLDLLKGICSFHPLSGISDTEDFEVKDIHQRQDTLYLAVGSPKERIRTEYDEYGVDHGVTIKETTVVVPVVAATLELLKHDEDEVGNDFLTFRVLNADLIKNCLGMSGGSIWKIVVNRESKTCSDARLVGLIICQKPCPEGLILTAHGPKTCRSLLS